MPENLWPGAWEDAGIKQTVNEVIIYPASRIARPAVPQG
jgi:hypothetical protein